MSRLIGHLFCHQRRAPVDALTRPRDAQDAGTADVHLRRSRHPTSVSATLTPPFHTQTNPNIDVPWPLLRMTKARPLPPHTAVRSPLTSPCSGPTWPPSSHQVSAHDGGTCWQHMHSSSRTEPELTCTTVMAATRQELEHGLFDDPNFDEKAQRFAFDAGCQVVYVTKERYLDVDEEGKHWNCPSCSTNCRPTHFSYRVPAPSPPYTSSQCECSLDTRSHQDVPDARLDVAPWRPAALYAALIIRCALACRRQRLGLWPAYRHLYPDLLAGDAV